MSEPRPVYRSPAELDAQFRESRIQTLITVNLHTYWSIVIILLAFGLWDAYVDPVNWPNAFAVRFAGAVIVAATGLFQNLPGRARWMVPLAKVRLLVAAVVSIVAASMLDRGYGFGVAGLIVIFLTGPYVAIDSRDLVMTHALTLIAVAVTIVALSMDPFDIAGTVVFVVLASVVSTLLGRVLESSYRRNFLLELEEHRDARTDTLTGLANRRAMQERGHVELKFAKRSSAPVSVILCDLDHFKNINDRHGHEAGDAALVRVAQVLRGALRESDALGRWGGEEFIAVLPATDAAGAREVAERMRAAIASTVFPDHSGHITISLGVTTSEDVEDALLEWDLMIKEADQRLYHAKHAGRNRVVADVPASAGA
ncbi:MAG: GGDEF domain-containing protein [Acidimicrobiia bacterium]|nr:GGDEF domain-containing protein [Acidimicrobiia bacterium]